MTRKLRPEERSKRKSGNRSVAIRFVTFDNGCMVPLNMKLQAEGYFHKRFKDGHEMFHRFIWRAHNGPIPAGHEINHMCGNRACQNVRHLECISNEEHRSKTSTKGLGHTYWGIKHDTH
jgi:hypothetical protein